MKASSRKKEKTCRQPKKNCPLHAKKIERSFTNSGAKQNVKRKITSFADEK